MSGQSGGGQVQGGQGGQPQGGPQGGQPPGTVQQGGGDNNEMVEYAKLGVVTYLVVGLGTFLYLALSTMIGDQNALLFSGTQGNAWWQATQSFSFFLPTIGVGLAAFLGVYYYQSDMMVDTAAKPAGVATAAGFAVLSILSVLLGTIFAPSRANYEVGKEFPGLIGALIVIAVVGAAVAFILENENLDLL